MATVAEIEAKVAKTVTNMDRLDVFVNGDGDASTTTDNGSVDSIANLARQVSGVSISGDPTARPGKFLSFGPDGMTVVPSAGTGADAGLRGDLAAAAGSSLLGFQHAGTGAVTRSTQNKLRELAISVTDYGALGTSNGSPGSGADDTTAFNNAVAEAIAIGARYVFVPPLPKGRVYRLSATFTLPESIKFVGNGVAPYDGTLGTRGAGSWLYFDHAGQGILAYASGFGDLSGGEISGLGFIRNQPASTSGWSPAANDFDLVVLQGDWFVDNLCFFNPTNAISHNYAGYGRLRIGYVYGDPYTMGLRADRVQDVLRVGAIHWWPYSGIDTNRATWKLANLTSAQFGHVDGAFIENFFCIGAKQMLFTVGADAGVPKNISFGRLYIDLNGGTGMVVDSTATGGSFAVSQLILQGATASDGNAGGSPTGIVIACDSFVGKVEQFYTGRFNQQAAIVTGGSRLYLGAVTLFDYNLSNVSATAFAVTNTAGKIDISAPVVKLSGGNGAGIVDNSGRVSSFEEATTSGLAVTSAGGTLTGATAGASFTRKGVNVWVSITVTMSANAATGSIKTALPIPMRGGRTSVGAGKDMTTGKAVAAYFDASSNQVTLTNYDGTVPTGMTITFSGSYVTGDF